MSFFPWSLQQEREVAPSLEISLCHGLPSKPQGPARAVKLATILSFPRPSNWTRVIRRCREQLFCCPRRRCSVFVLLSEQDLGRSHGREKGRSRPGLLHDGQDAVLLGGAHGPMRAA